MTIDRTREEPSGRRLSLVVASLRIGASFLGAAAVFHLLAAPHIGTMLRTLVDRKAYGFLEPILSFTFLLNAVLLVPLSFTTFYSASGIRRGEGWARPIALVNALTVVALPCTMVATMGLRYFADAPLFLAGAVSVTAAGPFMLAALLWPRKGTGSD